MPREQRIEMVMGHMTLEDKMMTMGEQSISGKYHDGSPLAARSVSWWNEALHGVCRSCGAKCPTQFSRPTRCRRRSMPPLARHRRHHLHGGPGFHNVGGPNGLT